MSSDPDDAVSFQQKEKKGRVRLWLEKGCGLVFFGLAIAFSLALVTYNPADPSLDVATSQPPTNLLGRIGAILADSLFQGVGGGALVPVFILSAWGWLLLGHRLIGHETKFILMIRVFAAVCLLPLSGALLAAISLLFPIFPTINWPSTAGIGGGIGYSIAQVTIAAGVSVFGSIGGMVVWIIGIVLFVLLLVLATGLSRHEWFFIGFVWFWLLKLPFRPFRMVWDFYKNQRDIPSSSTKKNTYIHQSDHYVDKNVPYDRVPLVVSSTVSNRNQDKKIISSLAHGMPTVMESVPNEETHRSIVVYNPNKNPVVHQEDLLPARGTSVTTPTTIPSGQEKPVRKDLLKQFFSASRSRQEKTVHSQVEHQTGWQLPSLSLLHPMSSYGQSGPSRELIQATARLLEQVFADYGVHGKIVGYSAGPVVTLYELEPAAGIRAARIIGLADDVARSLSVLSVRIATVPGRNVMGIEVPNHIRETVYLSELLSQPSWQEDPSQLLLALGKDIGGNPVFSDLARMPHLLVAGTTGSGKSVGINAMILSLLYRRSPDECRLIMIDPKVLELSIYDGIPHLLTPVVTEPSKAVNALKWVVKEMDRRYRVMAHMQVRNITGYNARAAEARDTHEIVDRRVQTGFDPETGSPIFDEQSISVEPMPYIVVVIDEMADLMMTAGKEIDACVQR
ncbi:MAG: DNA translocase FtsK 4TM domain-containing protein, partial [Acetobacter sp.]|nr:DNA translocase FtsK 4TM domain-containing protein [Acetobacter sp.]